MTIALLMLVAIAIMAMLLCPSYMDDSAELVMQNHQALNRDL